jgi:5'-nucleotidase
MNILLVNDDGVHAAGINILKETLSEVANVYIVAPLEERSTTGHTLTLDHTIRISQLNEKVYGCSGFPADCTLVGIGHVFKKILNNTKIDLVISGINRGANLGQDIYYSGTVAAAREAAFHGIPSIAVSSCMDFRRVKNEIDNYYTASNFIKYLVKSNVVSIIHPMTMLNINVPWKSVNEILGNKVTKVGFRKYSEDIDEREDFRGRKYYWIGGTYNGFDEFEDSDCMAVENNFISISPLKLYDYGVSQIELNQKVTKFLESIK